MQEKLNAFERLLIIMDELREQCPWDKKQTIESLRHLTIEETYELADAIIKGDLNELKGEIGDLMLHMVFYCKIASEAGEFDIADALNGVCEKLINRHPHIYGDVKVSSEEEVKANWEKIKLKEGREGVLSGVPASLPALVKAIRVQDKVKGIGFDWDNKEQVLDKIKEELEEFNVEVEKNDKLKMEEEFGDILFSVVNYARFVGINPEDALEKTNRKFIKRFSAMEKEIKIAGEDLKEMPLVKMEEYWQAAKKFD